MMRRVLAIGVAATSVLAIAAGCSSSKSTTSSTTTTAPAGGGGTTASTDKDGCEAVGKPPAGSPELSIKAGAPYSATIVTSEGTMVVALNTCTQLWGANNFITLARKGFYDNSTFHRAARDFVIQGGDPNGNGTGGPGYSFVSEVPRNAYAVGDLAYAKRGSEPAGTAGSQFFIITNDRGLSTFNAKPYQYGQFGTVRTGLDVAKKIEALAPTSGDGAPTRPVSIKSVTITGP